MGNRAIYQIKEAGEWSYFTAHYGANALTPLLRLAQAMEEQEKDPGRSIAQVFGLLDYEGNCHSARLRDGDMVFCPVTEEELEACQKRYVSHSDFEMRITLDLDGNQCLLEYNPNCPWYRSMGSYSIDIDAGLENVRRLQEYGENQGITDFYELLAIYHNSTGLAEKLEDARGSMGLSGYTDSPQAGEQRLRYREMQEREVQERGWEDMER